MAKLKSSKVAFKPVTILTHSPESLDSSFRGRKKYTFIFISIQPVKCSADFVGQKAYA